MKEAFEKIVEKLGRKRAYYNAKFESTQNLHEKDEATTRFEDFNEAIEIVKQAAEECKHGHFGCNSNGQHEKCSACCDYDCKHRNREWFGVKDDNNSWIPCSVEMPKVENLHEISIDDCTGYLVQRRCGLMDVAHYISVYGVPYFEANALELSDVIAWQPLPAPYQPKGDNKKKTNFDMCCESMEAMAQIIDIAKIGWTKEQVMEWLEKEECEVPE